MSNNLKEKAGTKSLLDYLLMDLHNTNPIHKKMSYHLFEENSFLQVISKFLKVDRKEIQFEGSKEERELTVVGGQVTVINSIPANK